ncbi:glycosyl transferase group 1 [Flammeovirgaceae bacterium 311]|nr:glycosyl transferase group 1 [Flammeovirgaceae bacterium 311]
MPTWEGDYMKTIVQIMSLLAKRHRVLYVDYTFTWKDALMGAVGKQNAPWQRMLGLSPRLRKIKTRFGSEVHVLTPPPVLPANWISSPKLYQAVMAQEGKKVGESVQRAIQDLGFQNPIVINAFSPFFGVPMAGILNESLLVYYCYDEISAAQWCGRHGAAQEKVFLELADGVITTSEALLAAKKKLNPNAYLVKNGVDYTLFHQGYQELPPVGDKQKVIGYLGSVDDRIDADLLEYCFQQMPAHKFVITGRIMSQSMADRFRKYTNVELRGSRQPEQLPAEVAGFHAGMIPFACNSFTKNIYPLKINEYLAAGLPVVMTDFAQLEEFSTIATVAGSKEEFVNKLHQVLESDTPALRSKRAQFALQNSWESRVATLEEVLQDMQEKKTARAAVY